MGLKDRLLGLFAQKEGPMPAPPGRNEPCWCGSGRKYKKCHMAEDEKKAYKKYSGLFCGST